MSFMCLEHSYEMVQNGDSSPTRSSGQLNRVHLLQKIGTQGFIIVFFTEMFGERLEMLGDGQSIANDRLVTTALES